MAYAYYDVLTVILSIVIYNDFITQRFEREDVPQESTATLLYVVKRLELAISNAVDDVADVAGLTSTQYTALTVLDRHPGMTAATLARNSFVRAQTAASLVNALERLGLVEREPDPTSRRQNLIFLTESGLTILRDLAAGIQAIEDRVLEPLNEAERKTLFALLQRTRTELSG